MDRETITMTGKDQQRALVLTRWMGHELATLEAVDLLGVSARQAWRLRRRFLAEGPGALVHGNRGRASPRRIPDQVRERVVELARTRYEGANDCHLTELLAEYEGIALGRVSVRRILRAAGQPSPRRHRPPRHRSRRERMPQEGLLLQLDGSRHDWLEGRGPWLTLLAAIDDATGRVVAATFRDEEDTAGYLELLRDIVRENGVPAAIYRDRHGAFEQRSGIAPGEETPAERRLATHVGSALETLGIRSIAARSPQAKGRIERSWGTDQDRLVLLLRLAGACDRDGANQVLAAYVPRRNRRFGVKPVNPEPAWREVPPEVDLDAVFAFHYPRVVANDHTVRIGGLALQLPALRGRGGYAGRRVDVQVRLDGRIVVEDRGQRLLSTEPVLDASRLRSLEKAPANLARRDLATVATDRAAYPPKAGHPWAGAGVGVTRRRLAQQRLTDSLAR
jgi:transposase